MAERVGIERIVLDVLAYAVERGDCKTFRNFRNDVRWASILDEAVGNQTSEGLELRTLQRSYEAIAALELVEGPGAGLDRDHHFNRVLSKAGLLPKAERKVH